jgi:hypothetical protein
VPKIHLFAPPRLLVVCQIDIPFAGADDSLLPSKVPFVLKPVSSRHCFWTPHKKAPWSWARIIVLIEALPGSGVGGLFTRIVNAEKELHRLVSRAFMNSCLSFYTRRPQSTCLRTDARTLPMGSRCHVSEGTVYAAQRPCSERSHR